MIFVITKISKLLLCCKTTVWLQYIKHGKRMHASHKWYCNLHVSYQFFPPPSYNILFETPVFEYNTLTWIQMSIPVSNFLVIRHQIHYPFITASAPLIDEVFPDLFGVGALELDREECCVIRTKLTNVHGSLAQLMVMVIMMVICK